MAYTTINKSGDYFNTSLWSGNGSAQTISGVGFQPDWLWTKCRSDSYSHILTDSVRGITKQLKSEGNAAEATNAQGVTAFNADGYVLGTQADFAVNGNTFVGWGWKANGAGSANTAGSINSTVSANTTSGFSIVSYTGNSTSGATVGHGLGAVPSMIIWKNLGTDSWGVYHKSLGNTHAMFLDLTNASTSFSTLVNNTTPSSSLITLGSSTNSNNSGGMIAYCFAEKTGYSKFGSYVGNGNADGTFIYTGFKPAFVLFKGSTIAENWWMFDTKRSESNVANDGLIASTSDSEYSNNATFKIDILSNGFKMRSTDSFANSSGNTYIYMAFAEAPLVGSNNVPCTAR